MEIFSNNAFNNKNIIIIGGAGDIGAEIARQFAMAGANKIALLDRDKDGLDITASQLKNTPAKILQFELDLADEYSIEQTITNLYTEFKS